MNRRQFFKLTAVASVGLVLDPERLLWVPGQKTIFLPPILPYREVVPHDEAWLRRNRRALHELRREQK